MGGMIFIKECLKSQFRPSQNDPRAKNDKHFHHLCLDIKACGPFVAYSSQSNAYIGVGNDKAYTYIHEKDMYNAHFPNTLPNKDLTFGTNQQPCERHHGVYLTRKPMTT